MGRLPTARMAIANGIFPEEGGSPVLLRRTPERPIREPVGLPAPKAARAIATVVAARPRDRPRIPTVRPRRHSGRGGRG